MKWFQAECSDNGTGVGSGQIGGIKFLSASGPAPALPAMPSPTGPLEPLPVQFGISGEWPLVEQLYLLAKEACDALYEDEYQLKHQEALRHVQDPALCQRMTSLACSALRLLRKALMAAGQDDVGPAELVRYVLGFLERCMPGCCCISCSVTRVSLRPRCHHAWSRCITSGEAVAPAIREACREAYNGSFSLFFPTWRMRRVVLQRTLIDARAAQGSFGMPSPAALLLEAFIDGLISVGDCVGLGLGFGADPVPSPEQEDARCTPLQASLAKGFLTQNGTPAEDGEGPAELLAALLSMDAQAVGEAAQGVVGEAGQGVAPYLAAVARLLCDVCQGLLRACQFPERGEGASKVGMDSDAGSLADHARAPHITRPNLPSTDAHGTNLRSRKRRRN